MMKQNLQLSDTCIELRHINQSLNGKKVLEDISITARTQSVSGILGPSGCGKTSVIKIAAGLTEADSGEAFICGKKMPDLNVMRSIGYMAQSSSLFPGLDAQKNLTYFGRLYGLSDILLSERINEVLTLVGLDDQSKVSAFSDEKKKLLSFAIAILHKPNVLILDDPTMGVRPAIKSRIWEILHRFAKAGDTVLVTTHDTKEAFQCTDLIMMNAGKIIATGTPDALADGEDLESAFSKYSEK